MVRFCSLISIPACAEELTYDDFIVVSVTRNRGTRRAGPHPRFLCMGRSDTGRGMSRSFIEQRLFRPFSTTKKTGIGLGLYTCREVIKASSGTIEVDSVEGAGTTFRVVLPSIPHDRRN